jgi:hypothetical protein
MNKEHPKSTLEPCLRAVWQRMQRKHISAGFLAIFRWGIPLFLLGIAIDRLSYLPPAGRAVILVILLGGSLYKAWQLGWRHLRLFNATHAALEVEKQHGGLESLLVTAVQFRESKTADGTSASLMEATCSMAEGTAGDLKPAKIVNFKSLKMPICVASALAGLVLVFAVINGPFLAAGLTRIFTPWTEIEYPTKTKLDLRDKDLVVKEGDSAKILIGLSGIVPDTAEFYLRTGDGDPREIELDVTDGSCEYTLASASRDFSYRIKAGDARSDWYKVTVIPAPRIQNVQVGLEFPSYLERANETVEALTLTVPQQTKLQWQITLDRPIREAMLHRDGKEPLPLQVTNDGRQVVIEDEAEASRGYSFSWVEDEHGYDFTSPRYYLQVASDQAPRVELTAPESNLVAMIGRPLSLAVRVQDDHGIGSTTVAYRVNQREKVAVEFKLPSENDQGDQPIDWDYRKAIPDLKIGDTVSFTVEVSDRYPGEDGPHIVRSDTRRITFLSERNYLRQIQKKKDSLLSRVQTIYRQQRSAFDSVRILEPGADSYSQICQVEAIRQELVRDQLKVIASKVKILLDDLAANNVSDAPQGKSLELVRAALLDIAETHLANAASRLRNQASVATGDKQKSPDPSFAARAVNTAARELGSLVLLRSIDTAQEVYAREARMLAQVQASLRWRTVQAETAEAKTSLSKGQDEIAEWTHRLIADLQNGMLYNKRPLAVLRLVQSLKGLQTLQTEKRMRQAAVLIKQGQTDKAESLQTELVTTLLDAEFSVRLTGAYTTLIKTRDQMRLLGNVQTMLREQCAAMSAQDFEARGAESAKAQKNLRKRLLTLLLPTVPAPRTEMLDETFPQAPPVQTLLKAADRAMVGALKQFAAGKQEAAIAQQREAEQALTNLAELVDRWSAEMGIQTLGLSTIVAATSDRLALIETFEAELISLLVKTDAAAAEEQKVNGLADSQQLLSKELAAFISDLIKQNQSNSDQDIPPLLSRMKRAEQAMTSAITSLKANNADEAIGHQEQAADILAEAYAIVTAQNEQLGLLQSLLMFQRSVRFANGYVADIVAEQQDLIKATKASKADDLSGLPPMFAFLRRCMDDVAPLLDLAAARVDAGTPLLFAATDLEDAVASLEDGDKLDSLDAQDVAAEALGKVKTLVKATKSETGYIAEIIGFLHASVADTGMLEYQQDELKIKTQSAKPDQLKAIAEEQRKLLAKAEKEEELLLSITGMKTYPEAAKLIHKAITHLDSQDASAAAEQMKLALSALNQISNSQPAKQIAKILAGLKPNEMSGENFMRAAGNMKLTSVALSNMGYIKSAKLMREVLARLESNDAAGAAEQMELARAALKANSESISSVITMLHGLPNMDTLLKSITDPGVQRLLDVLVVASAHKELFRDTNAAKQQDIKAMAARQSELATRCQKLSQVGKPHAMLTAATLQLTTAATAMQLSGQDETKRSQKLAMQTLRHFIIEQALVLDTTAPPSSPVTDPPPNSDGPGSDTDPAFSAGFAADFASGERAKDQRAGWDVRADRNRAALNQNFARELPLEYRGLLKNYYERVAK